MRMTRSRRALAALALAGSLAGVLAGCDGQQNDPRAADAARSQQATGDMMTNQPVAIGQYSPTREAINQWVKTWESAPGKLAYVYVFMGGQPVGYYVIKGPPVSYAQGATNPYHTECPYSSGAGCLQVANPGQDGSFANQGTGQFQWYGVDATSGAMVEWGGGTSSYLLSSEPLAIQAPPLGAAKIGQVKGR